MDRRAFLGQSVTAAAAIAGLSGCTRTSTERATAPAARARGVVDTHTHFYDPSRPQGVPWPAKGDALLYRTVLPPEYKRLAVPLGITGTVVVEASPWVEDNAWLLDVAKDEPFILGICGNLTPGDDGFREHLAWFAKHDLFRGIRISGEWLRGKLGEERFTDDLRRLADAGRQLDVNVGTAGLGDVARLADRVPALRVVLDHCANTPIDGGAPNSSWRDGMRALAGRRNVWAKLSGLVEGTGKRNGDAPEGLAFYQPVLEVMWQAFGADRLIYGSNWPVSARFAPLAVVHGIIDRFLADRGAAARERVFATNAMAAYGLEPR
jgi:L-fuconolactonase